MFKVRTTKSRILIKQKNFPQILERLKRYFIDDKDVQSTRSVHLLLRKMGWGIKVNLRNHNIVSLTYGADEWTRMANSALLCLSKFIEPGGFIHVIDDNKQKYYAYHFDGTWFSKKPLTRIFIDLSSKEEVSDLFQQAVDAAIKQGLTRDEMVEHIKQSLLAEYLDN